MLALRADPGGADREERGEMTRETKVGIVVSCSFLGLLGVVVVLDTSAQPLWLWGPVAAALTASFGGLMRDCFVMTA